MNTCACGCGQKPRPGNRFIHGHNGGPPLRQRVLSCLIIDPSGCLLWNGRVRSTGYATVSVRSGDTHVNFYVHRLMYEWFVGPIPEGMQIDHLCRVRRCASPAHLEAVTRRENILRGEGLSAQESRQTYCNRGHEFDLLNTYWTPNGRRQCRACTRERARRYYAAIKMRRTEHDHLQLSGLRPGPDR